MPQYKPKVRAPHPEIISNMQSILSSNQLTTVCEAASCPNRAECYARGSATFMILGNICTRACQFCNIATGHPHLVDTNEPEHLAQAIKTLKLKYVVITSVDRDDLADYGAGHFSACVKSIKAKNPEIQIELLTPDFRADETALDCIIQSGASKLAHNQETVRRLSKKIRPQSDYNRSLKVLQYYANKSSCTIKSSLMLGLGESQEELLQSMQELLDVGVQELTLGQYLQPSPQHHRVEHYYSEAFFQEMKEEAYSMGFSAVASGILVRSSYFAEEL